MKDFKGCSTPMSTSPHLNKYMGESLPSRDQYRQVVSALHYITLTRLDISFSVNKLAQFMHCVIEVHWQACKWFLRYLRETSDHGLFISKNSNTQLQCYSDNDWAGCSDNRHSINGYLIYLDNNLISWTFKKQPTVARSSIESEYKALANTST